MKKEDKLIRAIKEWCYANDWSETLPPPTREVKKWVKIQSKVIKDVNQRPYFHTLYYQLISSKFSKSSLCTIIEQELTEYEQNSFRNPKFCGEMQIEITDILYIYTTPDYRFQKAKTLIRKAKTLWFSSRIGGLRDCIHCLSRAISIMDDISAAKCGESADSIHRQLCVAHCMRALCKQEAKPCSKQIFKDIKIALDLWHKIYSADSFEEKELCALPNTVMILLYNIVDLLQIKGFMELSNDACQLVIEIFKLRSVRNDKWLSLLWESRRLNHALCFSPVDQFWINSFKGNHSKMTEFLSQTNITADEVYKMATGHPSTSFVGQLYLDLSRRLVAQGQLKEALLHAKKARDFYLKEFRTMWEIKTSDEGQNYTSIVKEFLLVDSSNDFEADYISPWKTMQFYLEAIHQIAIVYEMIGDGDNALSLLKWGKHISCLHHFPLFMVVFSSLLGKLYIKMGESDTAIEELEYALKIFKDNQKSLGCFKCKSILFLTLWEYLGDLTKSVEEAKEHYKTALNVFNRSEWKDLHSFPEDGSDAIRYEVMEQKSPQDFINLKWESVQRQLQMELHTRLVKCSAHTDQVDEACHFLLRSISILVGRNSFSNTLSSNSIDFFGSFVATEISGDTFAIQRAEIIYDICWYSLKYYRREFTRKLFCNLSSIKFEDLASWLTIAFVLSRDVPKVFLKVSKLLAVMYVVSSSSQKLSLSSLSKDLGENYWSLYFHQASIGTHFTNKFHLHLTETYKGQCDTGSFPIKEDTYNSLGLVPKETKDLLKHVKIFLVGLSSTTIINISLLGCDYTSLLQELPLPYPHHTHVKACMLVSRLTFETEPVVVLLPVESISEDESDLRYEKPSKDWFCPSGFTVVDETLPEFNRIIEEDYILRYLCLKTCLEERFEKLLEERFEKLLRNLEDCWFGPWKCLLLGEWLNCKKVDLVLKNLVESIRFKCKSDVNEGLLKIILGGSAFFCEGKTFISQLCSKKCYIAKIGYVDEAHSGILLNAADKRASKAAFKLLENAINELEVDDFVNREPVILVLDYEVQMLPWESLPIARKQEIYRMPSVSSIFDVLYKGSNRKEQVERKLVPFPSIDPYDAFYLIDPELDYKSYENYDLLKLFRSLQLEGKVCSKPTVKEMVSALENHQLFIYFGHGCGSQYIPCEEIEELEKCPAAFLLGCSSSALISQGSYAPICTPLSYLLAGSPAIIGHLWHVLDHEAGRFGFAIFKASLENISNPCLQCNSANSLSEEFEEKDSPKNNCCHRIGAFMPQAREACLHFLTGASAVCYGLPATVCRKKDIESHQPNKHTKFD